MSSKPADGYSLQRRMIAVTTATLCGIALTAGVLTFTVSWQYLMRRVYTMVDRLVEDLQDEYHELGGLTTEFAQHMDIDAAEHDVNRTFIVLSTRNGRELRATSMPERLKARILRAVHQGRREHRFYTERASPSDRHVAVRLKTLELNDGNLITVARDVTDIERYLLFLALTQGIAVILGAFFTGLGVTLIVTRFVRRLKAVASTATAIAAGDWSRRVEEEKKESREVRALVRAFNGMCDKNEKTLNELRVLTDNIAHDLRTPLTRLSMAAETVLTGGTLRDPLPDRVLGETRGGRIDLSLDTLPEGVRLVVADTGCGIPAADLPHIYTRFWRADASRSLPGNGLGLALVKAIVTSYGGRLHCDSVPGQGSAFTVVLPTDG